MRLLEFLKEGMDNASFLSGTVDAKDNGLPPIYPLPTNATEYEHTLTDDQTGNGLPSKLYHGTSIFNLVYILQSNKLVEGAHWSKPHEPHGPRLTKSPDIAIEFFSYATPDLGGESPGALIELDTARLDKSYELVEYEDKMYGGDSWGLDEQEVVVVTNAIEPLNNYVTSIVVKNEHAQFAITDDILEFAISWPYLDVATVEEARALVVRALKHPSVRIV